MANFFVKLDTGGIIEEVKWTTDSRLFSQGESLLNLLEDDKAEEILEFLQNPSSHAKKHETLQIRMGESFIQLSLYLMKLQGEILGIGISGKIAEEPVIGELLKMYNELFNQLRGEIKKSSRGDEEQIQERFEDLQKLNNELTNTKRKIEKANVKLESLNKELQTKLMKDPLTGLAGRYQFWVGIRGMIENDPDKQGIFVYIDIDDFKDINDTFGHVGGDQFLIEIGERIKAIPLDEAMKIRISGDEFGIFIHGFDLVKDEDFQELWELIQRYLLNKPVIFNQIPIPVSISAGMAVLNYDSREIEELIEYADFAMYQAKRDGKNRYRKFDKKEFEEKRLMKEQGKAVKDVIASEDLYHVYQPIFSAEDGGLVGYVAHMRTKNRYFPDTSDLIENAFRENLYVELDLLSFQKLSQGKNLARSFGEKLLFVPHGPYSFKQNEEIKKGAGKVFPNRLVLDIVEGKMANPEFIGKIIRNGKKYGFLVSVSNFASGDFDDLGILATAPAFIKIGRATTAIMPDNRELQEKIRRIVGYAHSQGTRVILEGIETREELEIGIRLNIDFLQGFYLGSPKRELPRDVEKTTRAILAVKKGSERN